MKRLLFALALVLFSGSVLAASAQTLSHKPQRTGPSLIISKYGTLLDVIGANGKSRFGKLERDGFRLTYGTKSQKAKVVSAVGSTQVVGLLPGEVKFAGSSARVTIMTEDKKLSVTSYFMLDEAANTLFIRRTIRNISCEPVQLGATRYSIERSLFTPPGGRSFESLTQDQQQLLTQQQVLAWEIDICPEGHCDAQGVCPTLSCSITPELEGGEVVFVGDAEELAECPCGPPGELANETTVSVAIAMSKGN